MEISRVFIAASSLGTSERALEPSIEHAKQRVTFGKPIGTRQAVQRYLAEMGTDVYALRGMLADATANWLEEGTPTIQYMVAAGQLLNGFKFPSDLS